MGTGLRGAPVGRGGAHLPGEPRAGRGGSAHVVVLPLELPPLRERGAGDIAQLARSALDELRRRDGRGATHLAPESLVALCGYAWPGNIREPRNVLERGLLLAPHAAAIEPTHLPPEIAAAGDTAPDVPLVDGELPLAVIERAHILRVLALDGFDEQQAARDLGITRATLCAKLRAYGDGDGATPTDAGEPGERG